jgi:hypothetical protein
MPPVEIDVRLVPAAALAALVVSFLWYSPWLFGRLRRAAAARDRTPEPTPPPSFSASLASALCALVASLAVAVLVSWLGLSTIAQGMGLGFVLWLGPAAGLGLQIHLETRDRVTVYLIDAGYQLAALVLLGAVLAGWG